MTRCKQCGLPVNWTKVDGKWKCHNPDGEDHWDLCSKTRFERIKREGEHFKTEFEEGYLTDLKPSGVQYVRLTAKKATGKRKIKVCDNCVPLWEVCPNGCPIEFRP